MASYAEAFIGTVRSSVVVLDVNLRVKTATAHFYETFQLLPKETEGFSIFDIGNSQWSFPEFRALLEERLAHQSMVIDFECEYQFPRLGRKKIKLNARQVQAASPENALNIISIDEVS
jgi:two-component system CheB/CheR fusion protein